MSRPFDLPTTALIATDYRRTFEANLTSEVMTSEMMTFEETTFGMILEIHVILEIPEILGILGILVDVGFGYYPIADEIVDATKTFEAMTSVVEMMTFEVRTFEMTTFAVKTFEMMTFRVTIFGTRSLVSSFGSCLLRSCSTTSFESIIVCPFPIGLFQYEAAPLKSDE